MYLFTLCTFHVQSFTTLFRLLDRVKLISFSTEAAVPPKSYDKGHGDLDDGHQLHLLTLEPPPKSAHSQANRLQRPTHLDVDLSLATNRINQQVIFISYSTDGLTVIMIFHTIAMLTFDTVTFDTDFLIYVKCNNVKCSMSNVTMSSIMMSAFYSDPSSSVLHSFLWSL